MSESEYQPMLIKNAVEGYLLNIAGSYSRRTIELYTTYLNIFSNFMGEIEIDQVKPTDLDRFMLYLRTEYQPRRLSGDTRPLSLAALDNHWKILRSFFGWGSVFMELERPDNNLKRPRYVAPEIAPFTEDEIIKIVKACDFSKEITRPGQKSFRLKKPFAKRDRALVLVLLDTGLRIGEVSRLKVEDVNLTSGQLQIAPYESSVKSRPRSVYAGKRTCKALWSYLAMTEKQPSDALFSSNISTLQSMVFRLGKTAGVSNCHPHRFRHTFAMEYLRNKGDPFTLQKMLGHNSLSMVQYYLRIMEADIKKAHSTASPVDNWGLR